MATTEPSKYAENQFLSATERRFPLMSEVLADTVPRATTAIAGNAAFTAVMTALNGAATSWSAGETILANAEAAQPAATCAFDDKMASLTRKPDADTSSLLETWDSTIRGQVAYQGPTYQLLVPQGRETVTAGSIEQQLDALREKKPRKKGSTGLRPVRIISHTSVFSHRPRLHPASRLLSR